MYRNLWNPSKYLTKDLEKTVLKVFERIYVPVDPQNIETCHRLNFHDTCRSNKVIVKFSKLKGMVRIMNKTLKTGDLDGTGLSPSTSLFIYPSLCSYYKYLWSKCKVLWSSKLTSSSECQKVHYE